MKKYGKESAAAGVALSFGKKPITDGSIRNRTGGGSSRTGNSLA